MPKASRKPHLDPDQPVEVRVDDLLKRMTLKEKTGQMAGAIFADIDRAKQVIKEHSLGAGAPGFLINNPIDHVNTANGCCFGNW